MTQQPLRIGMFGGAFDPPHRAHLALAHAAREQLQLQYLHVVPTGQAWHKSRQLTPAAHRWAMCQAAFQDCPGVVLDDRELRRAGPSYTVQTLSELASAYPGAELFLIIGWDQLSQFKTWSRFEEVLAMASLAVAQRPGVYSDPIDPVAHRVLRFEADGVSSTQLRESLASAQTRSSAVSALPDAVARYIAQHQLY